MVSKLSGKSIKLPLPLSCSAGHRLIGPRLRTTHRVWRCGRYDLGEDHPSDSKRGTLKELVLFLRNKAIPEDEILRASCSLNPGFTFEFQSDSAAQHRP